MDGNSDMRNSDLSTNLTSINLREVILEKHGLNGPATYRRNVNNTPIDGIWASPSVNIERGGYFQYDEVFANTDHRCIWIDISYITAFGHNMPPIIRPKARRLHNKDPRIVNNFIRCYKKFINKHNLLEKSSLLLEKTKYPASNNLQEEYEALDKLRCEGVSSAEKRCRKLRTGQVSFSPEIQKARDRIYAWLLLQKRSKGLKISSRLLERTMKKANVDRSAKNASTILIKDQLTEAYRNYFQLKASQKHLRQTHLEQLAEAIAEENNTAQENILRLLREREKQRTSAKKIRYL
jgi:hypothetical protein